MRHSAIPRSDVKAFVKNKAKKLWSQFWLSQPLTNKLRNIKPSIAPFDISASSDRLWERILCRLRIGLTHLTHQYLMDKSPLPYCQDCLIPLTVFHILQECPTYGDERLLFFGPGSSFQDKLTLHASESGPLRRFLIQIDLIYKI